MNNELNENDLIDWMKDTYFSYASQYSKSGKLVRLSVNTLGHFRITVDTNKHKDGLIMHPKTAVEIFNIKLLT